MRRKPLALQQGHLSVVKQQELQQEEASVATASDQLLKPPSTLTDVYAKNEWRRVVPQLLDIDVVGNLDLSNLVGYCNAWAQYRRATEQLAKEPLVYIAIDEKTGLETRRENPTLRVQQRAAQEMRKFGDMCGMSISSRLKAAATKTKKKADSIEQTFGVI